MSKAASSVYPSALSDTAVSGFKQEISKHQYALSIIDEEIETLMRTVRQLEFKKRQHQDRIKYFQGMMTLAHRLPPEILANVFDECVRDGWTKTPLVASHVCTGWRKAAQIPSVWSHVYVDLNARNAFELTRFWLEKAQDSFLDVTLEIGAETSQIGLIIDLLLTRSSLWRAVTINAMLLSQANYIIGRCNRPAPALRSVNVSVREEFDGADADRELRGLDALIESAPLCCTVTLCRNILPAAGTVPHLITHMTLILSSYLLQVEPSLHATLGLLRTLPLLEEFRLELPRGQTHAFTPAQDDAQALTLTALQSLVLTGSRDLFSLLQHLRAPGLRRLHLRSSYHPIFPDHQLGFALRRFLDMTSHSLEVLELYDVDIPALDFAACFPSLAALKELRLHESEIPDEILDHLNATRGLCPSLEHLDFRWCGQLTGRTLVELAESRLLSAFTRPLISVTVINCSFVEERDIFKLADMLVCRVVADVDDYCREWSDRLNMTPIKSAALRTIWLLPE